MNKTRRTTYFPLKGGEDLITPLFNKKPGTLINSQNFECDPGGRYRRIAGYERFDGQTAPTGASYWVLNFDQGTAAISDGDTVTGASSGATGEALLDAVVTSGSYVGNDAAGYLVLGDVSGTYTNNENLQVSAVTKCVADGTAVANSGTSDNHTTWSRLATAAARANIAAVAGSGDILGVHLYNNILYAFRANAGGTAVVMHKSSSSGWATVDLGSVLDFDTGTVAFAEGETLTGGVSGATATIMRIVVESGTWAGGDADGYLVLHSISGTFQNNELITDSAVGSATSDGIVVATSLATGGRFECLNYNFYGHSGSLRMYGCDGANTAFEFDGTTFTPIRTGMTSDTPAHITAHKKHLFLSFTGGSVQHSSIGDPLTWSAVAGASEIGLGVEVVGMVPMPGDTLFLFGDTSVSVLYGTSSADWNLKTFSHETGAREWSIQRLSDIFFMDDNGVTSAGAVDAYGDFKTGSISGVIQTLIDTKKELLIASLRVKDKEQYRIFFSDNTGINLTFNGNKITGFTRLKYDDAICCTTTGQDANGSERIFFGSDDGMVYELDKGTSLDGGAIVAFLRTWLHTVGSPDRKKRFFKIVLEKDDAQVEGFWGVGEWGSFEWGKQRYDTELNYVHERDNGYEYFYYASEEYETPYTLQGIILHYSNGGLNR